MDKQILIGAAAGGIVMALALSVHWGLSKFFPRIPWRLSVGIMVVAVFGLAYLATKLE